jgi:hypothetical protein
MPPHLERPAILIVGSVMALYGLIALARRESGLIVQQRRREGIARLFATIMGTIWLLSGGLLVAGTIMGGRAGSQLVGFTAVGTAIVFFALFFSFFGFEIARWLRHPPEPAPKEPPVVLPSPPLARFHREMRVSHPALGSGVVLDSYFNDGVERVTAMFYEEITTVDATSLRVEH